MRQFFLYATIIPMAVLLNTASGYAQSTLQAATEADREETYILTLEEAVSILQQHNNAIKISRNTVEAARARRQQLQSAWYPTIMAAGGYMHFSNDISADANVGELSQGIAANLPESIKGLEQIISQLIPQFQQIITSIGSSTLSVPLIEQDVTTFDAVALWPLITGGKRIWAGRIGKELEESARHLEALTSNAQMAIMLNAYYTLKLSRKAEQMQQENLQYMNRLHHNASRLMQEGFINKAEYLVVQVAADEASREYESALQNTRTAADALNAILGKRLTDAIPQGNFFVLDSLPDINTLYGRILQHNPQLKILQSQEEILENKVKIARSNYIPNFALFAKQNLYSRNIPKNLMPRTTIGVAMQWEIFNGFAREKEIKAGKLELEEMEYTAAQAGNDLLTAAQALRGKMSDASHSIRTLQKTILLARELLREREKSFAEGMCTSTDIVAARTALTRAQTALEMAGWQYCTSLAALLALSSETDEFIRLHNASAPITVN
ncbi:MAG: TolC family protein [Bacteroidales bacterium]|nr:TolC family protein [Bacteroidales bacterium]